MQGVIFLISDELGRVHNIDIPKIARNRSCNLNLLRKIEKSCKELHNPLMDNLPFNDTEVN